MMNNYNFSSKDLIDWVYVATVLATYVVTCNGYYNNQVVEHFHLITCSRRRESLYMVIPKSKL